MSLKITNNIENKRQEEKSGFLPVNLLNVFTISFVALLIGYIFWSEYVSHITEAKQNSKFVANLVAIQSRENIVKIEKMLTGIERELKSDHFDMENPLNNTVKDYLHNVQTDYKNLIDILIIDNSGKIIHWSGEGNPPDVMAHPYVTTHLNIAACFGLYIGEPLLSKEHKEQWFFSVSLPICNNSRELQYIAVAIVDINLLHSQLMENNLLLEHTVLLVSRSGNVITQNSKYHNLIGQPVNLMSQISNINDKEGNFIAVSPINQLDSIFGFYTLKEHGITVFASVSKQEILKRLGLNLIRIIPVLAILFAAFVYLMLKHYHDHKKIAEQRQQLFLLANTDELTGLYNRRNFMSKEKTERIRSKRYQRPLSYIMLDIDHFKAINDTYGHECGDSALKWFAKIMKETCRTGDVLCRYGGEEFIIMLPETSQDEAINLAERLRKKVSISPLQLASETITMTASFGVTCYDGSKENNSDSDFINQADKAMYQAKKSGRDRVCYFSSSDIALSPKP